MMEWNCRFWNLTYWILKFEILGRYQSGQLGQTVNLLAYAFVGSNPALPTKNQISKIQNPSPKFWNLDFESLQF